MRQNSLLPLVGEVKYAAPQARKPQTSCNQKVDDTDSLLPHHQLDSEGKECACNAGDRGSILGSERSGEGNGYPL